VDAFVQRVCEERAACNVPIAQKPSLEQSLVIAAGCPKATLVVLVVEVWIVGEHGWAIHPYFAVDFVRTPRHLPGDEILVNIGVHRPTRVGGADFTQRNTVRRAKIGLQKVQPLLVGV
jgi:hypothetical protein